MADLFEGGADVWHVYQTVASSDVLQQGDLVRFSSGDCLRRLGIVVTADCDLDKKKHSRIVTLVPLLSVDEIIRHCLVYEVFDNYSVLLADTCRRILKITAKTSDLAFLANVRERLLEDKFESIAQKMLAQLVIGDIFDMTIPEIKGVLELLGVKWSKMLEKFKSQIMSRGDLLLLASPPLIKDSSKIAWLRAMWQEHVTCIALRTSEEAEKRGIRMAQLKSPYRYRLTQMLGQVFADIGLPEIPKDPMEYDFSGLEK